MKRVVLGAVLLVSTQAGCFLFPLKDGPCGDGGACSDGGPRDLVTPAPPDLMPSPDLTPQCRKQSDCSGGLGCVAGTCQACLRHSDCDESLVCDVYQPQPGAGAGRCLLPSELLHVDNNAVCAGADGSRDKPFCTLPEALAMVSAGRSAVRVAASNKDYGTLSAAALLNKTATIYGPAGGDDGKSIATLGQGANVDAVIANSGTNLTLDGVELRGGLQRALFSNSANATLTVRRAKIIGFAKVAVSIANGALTLDRTQVSQNLAGAFNLGVNSRYTITNSFIVDNRIPETGAAIFISNASGTFRYNTVANNTNLAPTNSEAAFDCNNVAQIEDSIVLGNTPASMLTGGESQLKNNCTIKNVVIGANDKATGGTLLAPDFESQSDFRLRDTDASKACCIDKGLAANRVDFFGSPRLTTPDIGAHELR